jgi:hypothetical protein
MFDSVYATPHAGVEADRRWFAEYELEVPVASQGTGGAR